MRWLLRPVLAAGLAASAAVVVSTATPLSNTPTVEAAVTNPAIQDSCGTDVTLVLDASGSVQSSRAEGKVRDAARAFLESLADTGSTARLLQFATFTGELAARAEVTDASLDPGGAFADGLRGYYNPRPPRPPGVRGTSIQYTNWDGSLRTTRSDATQLVVYITDGDPTAYDRDGGNTPGDPFDDRLNARVTGSHASQEALDRAVVEADALKAGGSRILAVGVGDALDSSSSQNRLQAISGPQVVRDSDIGSIGSINNIDVALVNDFDQLGRFLRSVVSELCAPSLSIRKLAQSSDSAAYTSTPGWDITATPAVASGTYRWVLPDTDATQSAACGNPADPNDQGPRTCPTDAQGLVQFQWEPDPKDATSTARISEAIQPGYTPGRPGAADYRCQTKDIDGNVTVDEDELDGNGFDIELKSQDIVTCVLYNSFDYQPDIEITKVDDPQQVRGDVSAGNNSTSTFEVTNPGNAALHDVAVIDDRCSPVAFQSGDADNDQLLDTDETWMFTCTRDLTSSPGDPVKEITNNALVQAKDPAGTVVTDTTTADVAVYAPGISIEKTPSLTDVPLNSTTDVTYTYVVTNTGNMILTNVGVEDDPSVDPQSTANSGCSPVTTTDSTTLAPAESATFTCTASLNPTVADQTFVNAARATGAPSFPTPPFTPVPGPNPTTGPVGPDVTAVDTAVVTTTNIVEGLELTKVALEPNTDDVVSVVFPDTDVLYRYTITNTGNVDLGRPTGDPAERDGWVIDNTGPTGICSPVTYVSGDTNNDLLLSPAVNGTPAETWTYECTATVTGDVTPVKNTAKIVAETPTPTPDLLVRTATATVSVVAPSMELVKAAVRPVVLDPAAAPDDGLDTPTPRPASYTYQLSNTGPVPIANVSLTDTMPQRPGDCADIVGPTGDAGNADVLDVGETWSYTCEIPAANPLTKADDDSGSQPGPDAPATVTDTATASGTAIVVKPNGQPLTVPVGPVTDTAVVKVVSPGIGLQKTPCVDDGGGLNCDPDPDDADDLLVRPGTDVTYRYEVSNTGDSRVFPVVGLDDKCAPVVYEAGDTNADGFIDVGETWEYRCTTPVDFPSPVVNEAGVLVVGPLGNLYTATDTARVRVFEPAIDLVKSVSDNFVPVGTTVTYTFEVTNAATSGTDGLPADLVLDQIDLVDSSDPANPTCDLPSYVGGDTNNNSLLDLEPLETWTYTCTGVIDERTVDVAGVVGVDVGGGTVFDFDVQIVTPYNASLRVDKTATPDRLDAPGGPVTYTYEVVNTGDIPLANVASTIADDTCSPVTYVSGDVDDNDLLTSDDDIFETGIAETWVFTCTTDVTVDTTNTVTLTGTPVDPSTDVPTPLGPAVPGTDTATVVVQSRSLAVAKTSDAASAVRAGDVIEYEVTVTNDGDAPWDATRLASVTDDLTGVLDDATYNGDAVATSANADAGTVTYSAPDLTWEGPLDPGQTATIRYSVTVVEPASSGGDGTLANTVTGPPESNCLGGDETGCTTSVTVTGLSIVKSSDAGAPVVAGDTITYSVAVTNAGASDYTAGTPAVISDDLSAALDDASFVAGSAAVTPDQGTIGLSGTTLTWTGPLAAGATVTLTYEVTVNDPVTGDGNLTNRVTGPPESNCTPTSQDPACTTNEPIQELRIVKTAAPAAVAPGGIVTYTVQVENTGGYAYTLADPATFTDDLAADGLLTYATWLGNATATIGTVDYTAPTVSWSGPLLPGDTATITFQIQVRSDNDVDGNDLVNTVVGPPESNCDSGPSDPDCTVTVPILERGLTIVKSSTPTTVYPGDVVAYTLTIANTGTTEETDVTVTDDLGDVLDDATSDGQPTASAGTAELIGNTLTWTGDLAVGETVTVIYSVTVDDPPAGNGTLLNTVTGPPESNCPTTATTPADECTTTTPIHQLDITKSSSGSSPVLPGSTVTYTVVIDNTGTADYTANNPAVVIDDLSDVLDDASIDLSSGSVTPPQGSAGILGDAIVWLGPLAAGDQVTITFDVVVDDPAGGDQSLVNTIVSPPESNCARGLERPRLHDHRPGRVDLDRQDLRRDGHRLGRRRHHLPALGHQYRPGPVRAGRHRRRPLGRARRRHLQPGGRECVAGHRCLRRCRRDADLERRRPRPRRNRHAHVLGLRPRPERTVVRRRRPDHERRDRPARVELRHRHGARLHDHRARPLARHRQDVERVRPRPRRRPDRLHGRRHQHRGGRLPGHRARRREHHRRSRRRPRRRHARPRFGRRLGRHRLDRRLDPDLERPPPVRFVDDDRVRGRRQ